MVLYADESTASGNELVEINNDEEIALTDADTPSGELEADELVVEVPDGFEAELVFEAEVLVFEAELLEDDKEIDWGDPGVIVFRRAEPAFPVAATHPRRLTHSARNMAADANRKFTNMHSFYLGQS